MNIFPVLPILVPLICALGCLAARRSLAAQYAIGIGGAGALLAVAITLFAHVWESGPAIAQIGGWPAPFGITIAADLFGAILVLMAAVVACATTIFSAGTIDEPRLRFGYYGLVHLLLMGVNGAFLTGDLFNLYVWFEVLLIASFVLITLGGERRQLEGAIPYVTLNLLSSALFLAAVGILYGVAGTLNMADLSLRVPALPRDVMTAVALLFLIAFGIKAAMFPLFFWLPASYHTPPVVVTALFSALLTKVGVYALIRVFTLVFTQDTATTHVVLLVLGAFTMVTGVLGAVAQMDVRRLLAFHIVSQIGYLIMGLGLFTEASLAATVYFLVHVVIAKSTLFLIAGIAGGLRATYDLKKLGGLYTERTWLAIVFLTAAFSLAGAPPLAGFFAKLGLIQAGMAREAFPIVAVALAVSLLTLYSMVKIWSEAFWKAAPAGAGPRDGGRSPGDAGARVSPLLAAPVVALAALSLLMGLAADPLYAVADRAARQLRDPAIYIEAVLGKRPAP
ncbi:MAG: Na+/H+ antiporter subunit D [Armatimonadetes bacterium]|nr:Na+/H+ antiporter subunit D [Armatimonadota bacterium]